MNEKQAKRKKKLMERQQYQQRLENKSITSSIDSLLNTSEPEDLAYALMIMKTEKLTPKGRKAYALLKKKLELEKPRRL